MRRGLAGLILGLSLAIASLAWAGFVMNHTVLDPGRSERLADQMLENETLRAALVSRLADSMAAALPEGTPIPRQQLETLANTVLDDPRVEALVHEGIVKTHQNALNGVSEPVVIDAGALPEATRDTLVAARPELDAVLPAAPPMSLELPNTGLSWLGNIRTFVDRAMIFGFLVAVAGSVTSLVVTKNRAAVLRRVSFWAFGAASFWLFIGYAGPWLAARIGPTSTAIATAAIDVMFGAMIRPALLMAGFGGVLLLSSFLMSAAQDRKPAQVLQPSRGTARTQPPQAPRRTPMAGQQSNVRRPAQPGAGQPPHAASRQVDQTAILQPNAPETPRAYPGQAATTGAPSPQVPVQPEPQPTSQRWVEGVGYVDEA